MSKQMKWSEQMVTKDFIGLNKNQKAFLKQLAAETCMVGLPMSKKAFIQRLAARGLVYWMVENGKLRVSIGGDAYQAAQDCWAGKLV